jgi:Tol biopolymer transport system component
VFFDDVSLDNTEIFVINVDGSDLTRLTNSPEPESWPDWSPDGQKIVFDSGRSGDYYIYVMNADGSGLTRLASGFEPAWSH